MVGEQLTLTMDCNFGIHYPKGQQTKTPVLDEKYSPRCTF